MTENNRPDTVQGCAESCAAPVTDVLTPPKDEGKKKKRDENRAPKSPAEKAVLTIAWLGLVASFVWVWLARPAEGQPVSALFGFARAGVNELVTFLSQHLISAMIPAFFVAAAISTFFSRETVIATLGRRTNPFLSYPLAALAGAILTVCSCGILPIFMSIVQSGAGIGPAITFLYSSPAVNLISLIYTWKILPGMMLARVFAVFVSGIAIGILMNRLFPETGPESEFEATPKKGPRSALQDWLFFGLLVLVMLTSTDALSWITGRIVPASLFSGSAPDQASSLAGFSSKIVCLIGEIILVIVVLRAWFTWDETRKWLKRTFRQSSEILPMVFLGVFYSGLLGGAPSLVNYLGSLGENTIVANLIASVIGALLYFGSIVGVNVVDLFVRWGMHQGPALALLLAGPTISLPSFLALMPIIGRKKAFAYMILIIVFSAGCGMIYGSMVPVK